MKQHKIELILTKTQLEQLHYYIEQAEFDGTYYGNKAQYWKRHNVIKEAVEKAKPS